MKLAAQLLAFAVAVVCAFLLVTMYLGLRSWGLPVVWALVPPGVVLLFVLLVLLAAAIDGGAR